MNLLENSKLPLKPIMYQVTQSDVVLLKLLVNVILEEFTCISMIKCEENHKRGDWNELAWMARFLSILIWMKCTTFNIYTHFLLLSLP